MPSARQWQAARTAPTRVTASRNINIGFQEEA